MDFVYLLRVLLKRKWIILVSGFIAAGVAYFFTRNEPKRYRSTAQVSTGFTVSDEIKVNSENFSVYEADTKFNNAIITTTSPSVVSLVAYNLILHDLESDRPFRQLNEKQKESQLYKEIDKVKARQVFKNKLDSMSVLTSYKPEEKKLLEFLNMYAYSHKSIGAALSVYRVQRTDYMQIDFVSENPELSAFVVNTVFQQFLRYYKSVRSTKSQESIDTLRSLMDKKKQELDLKNLLLRGENAMDVGLESTSNLELISSLERTLIDEKSKQAAYLSALRKINQRLNNTSPTASTGINENDELLILRKQMNDAYAAYLSSGSTDKELFDKYNKLKVEYQKKYLSSTMPQSSNNSSNDRNELLQQKSDIEIDIQASGANIEAIQEKINRLKGIVISDASKGASVETLMKEADQANKEYLAAKERYSEAIDISTSSVNNFRQVQFGQPAIDPEPSKRKLIIGMAGIGAVITTILIFVLLAYLDSSVKTPGIFARAVNLKLISMVNFMNLKNKNIQDIIRGADNMDNIKDKQRHNIFRESIRKLRYEIEKSGKKSILFASTKKGQGKTTLIQALSFSLSQSKKKVLIIDTNFCNNDLTLQLNAKPILEKISLDNPDNSDIILEQIKLACTDTGQGLVFAIGSEGGDYTPSEILPKQNILHHLKQLTGDFDYIFLEGPPLNDFSDSKELSLYVEGVIAVFSSNDMIRQIDKESIQFFKELDNKFIGAVLNMVDLRNINIA